MSKQRWLCVIAIGALSACADATGIEQGEPPELPPVESLTFDMAFFDGGGAPQAMARQAQPGLNWAAAALGVAAANLSVVVHLAVPVATWHAARLETPVLEDGRWHWRFDVAQGGQTYGGDLAGYGDGSDVVFEMRVSSSVLQLDDFLWYTGRAAIGGTGGEWVFHDPDDGGAVAGRIDWTHPDDDVWTLAFTAVTGDHAGDALVYAVDGSSRTVTFTDASEAETAEVGWDEETREGYVIAPGYNGGVKSCWDGTLANAPCAG